MKSRTLIILGIIIMTTIPFATIVVLEGYENYLEQLEYEEQRMDNEPIKMEGINLIVISTPREFLRMNCEDLYMYQEPPSQDVADAWNTRLHECQNGQENLPILIELERWRQTSCLDILNGNVPKFENVVSLQAFDIRHNQCVEIMEHNLDEPPKKIPEELEKMGCTDEMILHLQKHSNAFDERLDSLHGIGLDHIGLPQGMNEHAFVGCMQRISELRDSEFYGCDENKIYFSGICMTPEAKEKAQSVGEFENEN